MNHLVFRQVAASIPLPKGRSRQSPKPLVVKRPGQKNRKPNKGWIRQWAQQAARG